MNDPMSLLAQNEPLTAGGMVMMIGCVTIVCSLCAFCFYRVLREDNPSEHHHGPLDIDTGDKDD